ncbi:MAG: DMT family transporter [Betaproteobacteria bacterium]|nr:DMT family transporter [Betaproteobacteria bacterium]
MRWSIPARAVLAAVLINILWGGNPIALKVALDAFPPLWSGLLRFALGSACVAAWARYARIPLWPTPGEWPALAGIGVLFTVQLAMMNIGFEHTSAVNGAVLIASNPLFGVLFAHFLVPGDRLRPGRALGALVAFAGTGLVLTHGAGPAGGPHAGDWIVLASACLLGLRLAVSGRVLRGMNAVRLTFWQMVISMPLFAAGALASETVRLDRIGVAPVAGILYQGVVIAGLAFTVNFQLIRRYTPSVVISFNFLAPVTGVLLGAWLLGETVTAGLVGGMLLVAIGLGLIARR